MFHRIASACRKFQIRERKITCWGTYLILINLLPSQEMVDFVEFICALAYLIYVSSLSCILWACLQKCACRVWWSLLSDMMNSLLLKFLVCQLFLLLLYALALGVVLLVALRWDAARILSGDHPHLARLPKKKKLT